MLLERSVKLASAKIRWLPAPPSGSRLAIVRSLVLMHGGTVTAHSEGRGRGSELVVELPALPIRNWPASSHPADGPVEVSTARRILVVEDDDDAVGLMADASRSLGHDVRVALDGAAAASIVRDFVPEVVLLDIGLPVMDGYEVARRLRSALAAHEVHFIAVSGYGQPGDRRHSEEAGFDAHLVKPVDLSKLQHTILGASPGIGSQTSREGAGRNTLAGRCGSSSWT